MEKTRNLLARVNQILALMLVLVIVQTQLFAQQPAQQTNWSHFSGQQSTSACSDAEAKRLRDLGQDPVDIGRRVMENRAVNNPSGQTCAFFVAGYERKALAAAAGNNAPPQVAMAQPREAAVAALEMPSSTTSERKTASPEQETLTVNRGMFSIAVPFLPGHNPTQEQVEQYQEAVNKFACLGSVDQQKLSDELKALPASEQKLRHLTFWLQAHKDTPCVNPSGEVPMEHRIIEKKEDLPADYKSVQWTLETRHSMVLFTQSHPDNAGCYGGWASATTEEDRKKVIHDCVVRDDYKENYIDKLQPAGLTKLFLNQGDRDQFVEKLIAGQYTIAPADHLYEANFGRFVSRNFVEINENILVAKVEITSEEGFTYSVHVNPFCANVMVPVQVLVMASNRELLGLGTGSPHDASFAPVITFEKKFSNVKDGVFSTHVTVEVQDAPAPHVFVRAEKFHNYGKTDAYLVVLHDQPPTCLVPFDLTAIQLVGPGVPIGTIAAGTDGPATAALSEWLVTCTTTEHTVDKDNLEYTTSENAPRAEAHAYLTVVMPPPPPVVQTVTQGCAPSCFGLVGTTAPYAIPEGKTLKLFVNTDERVAGHADANLVKVVMKLDDDYGKHHKDWKVGDTVEIQKWAEEPINGTTVRYLESRDLFAGLYSADITFSVNGVLITCPIKIWVPKKGMSKWVPVITFAVGVGVGIFIGYEFLGGAGHIVGTKPVGTALQSITGGIRPIIPTP